MKKEVTSGNQEVSVFVSGSGKTKEEAFARAISKVQKSASQQVAGTVIRIEPLEVELLEGNEVIATERFLFLFFKREVSTFTVKVKVKVNLYAVDINCMEFKKEKAAGWLKK